jgi:hypothetical protein
MGNTLSMKKEVGKAKAPLPKTNSKFPNEMQYDRAGAFSMIAYKNQSPNSDSDLKIAKVNFENKYKSFLTLYGQYSNTPLRKYPSQEPLSYPINPMSDVFKYYPNKKPRNGP